MVVDTIVGSLGSFAPIGILVFRNVYGWLHEALKNGKLEKYEVKYLGKNLLGLGSLSILLSLGVPSLSGVDSTALVATLDAVRNDLIGPLFHKK